MATAKKILTPEQVAEIDNALRVLHDSLPVFDAAHDCGVECTQWMAEREALVYKLTKMKEYFG